MRIVTRCTSLEQFITIFRRFVHESSCFIPSLDSRPPGSETAFSIRLADGTPVLRGLCEVIENWKTSDNPFKRPGVYIGIKRLTADSAPVFRELQIKPEDTERRRKPKDTIADGEPTDGAPSGATAVAKFAEGTAAKPLDAPGADKVAAAAASFAEGTAAKPVELADAKPGDGAEPASGGAKTADAKAADAKAAVASAEPAAVAAKPAVEASVDTKPVDASADADAKPAAAASAETKPATPADASAEPADVKPVTTKPLEGSADAKSTADASAPGTATKPDAGQPADAKPVDARADVKLVADASRPAVTDAKPADTKIDPHPSEKPERAKATTDGDALVPQDVAGDLDGTPMTAIITSGSETSRIQVGAATKNEPLATVKMPRMAVPDIKPVVPIAKPAPKLPAISVAIPAESKPPTKPSPTPTVETPPLQMQYEVETRAPGSGWVLPANPLTSLSDDKLEAFIDCTLYEETEDTSIAEVLSLPKDGALGMGVAPAARTEKDTLPVPQEAPPPAADHKSLAQQLAASTPAATTARAKSGREQIATMLGVAPLVAAKVEPPVVVPSQVPKPFRTTVPKAAVEPVEPPTIAATPTGWSSHAALKPALIAAGIAIAITIVILLASSARKPAQPTPTPPSPTTGASKPAEPAAAIVQDQEIEMDRAEIEPAKPNDKAKQDHEVAPEPGCKLVVNTTPPGAWVRVDSDYKGKSPVTVDGPCKQRKIEVAANGFETQIKRISVTADETVELELVRKKPSRKPATTKPAATKPVASKSGKIDI